MLHSTDIRGCLSFSLLVCVYTVGDVARHGQARLRRSLLIKNRRCGSAALLCPLDGDGPLGINSI